MVTACRWRGANGDIRGASGCLHDGVDRKSARRGENSKGSTERSQEKSEPGGNRTHNPQIKSLLLCQLSYRPSEKPRLGWARRRARGETPILPCRRR